MGRDRRKNAPAKKRGPTSGFTSEQHTFLKGFLPEYIRLQPSRKYSELWARVHTDFNARWPMPPLTDEEVGNGLTMESKAKAVIGVRHSISKFDLPANESYRKSRPGLTTTKTPKEAPSLHFCWAKSERHGRVRFTHGRHTVVFIGMTRSRSFMRHA